METNGQIVSVFDVQNGWCNHIIRRSLPLTNCVHGLAFKRLPLLCLYDAFLKTVIVHVLGLVKSF